MPSRVSFGVRVRANVLPAAIDAGIVNRILMVSSITSCRTEDENVDALIRSSEGPEKI